METLKAKWLEMGLYRRILLAVMLAEIVGFLIAYVIVVNRPGLEYCGRPALSPARRGSSRSTRGRWTGSPPGLPSPRRGKSPTSGGSSLTAPGRWWRTPTALPETVGEHGGKYNIGLEISAGGTQVLFRGAYSPHSFKLLIDENGRAGAGHPCLCWQCRRGLPPARM